MQRHGSAAIVIALVATIGAGIAARTAGPQGSTPPVPVVCDVAGYSAESPIAVSVADAATVLEWGGSGDARLRLSLVVSNGTPRIQELALRNGAGPWVSAGTDLEFEFKVVEGLRRISSQQLVPLRELGVSVTQEVVDRYKWDVFWDAPLDLSLETGGGNPPPAEGVAEQPGLPRSPVAPGRQLRAHLGRITERRLLRDLRRGPHSLPSA